MWTFTAGGAGVGSASAGAASTAGYVTVGSGEYTAVLSREQAEDERVLLALEQAGTASPRRAGFPRLVGPAEWDCFLSVRSVDRIEVTREPQRATAATIALARLNARQRTRSVSTVSQRYLSAPDPIEELAHAHDPGTFPARTLPEEAAFWILAVLFLMLFFASAAASPLYRVYQVQFRFSAITLTAVFAVYVLVLLVTLLFFGSVSDYLGRLPVIITALVFSVAGCGVFLVAHGVGALYLARSLQGIATGLASGPIGAALIDLQPAGSQRAPLVTSAFSTLGLALGALIDQRARPVRPGADPPDLVGAAGRLHRRHRRRAGHARTRVPASRRPGLAAAQGRRAASGPGHLRRSRPVFRRGLGARRPVPVAGAVAGR